MKQDQPYIGFGSTVPIGLSAQAEMKRLPGFSVIEKLVPIGLSAQAEMKLKRLLGPSWCFHVPIGLSAQAEMNLHVGQVMYSGWTLFRSDYRLRPK